MKGEKRSEGGREKTGEQIIGDGGETKRTGRGVGKCEDGKR